jgi:hypothetical protein
MESSKNISNNSKSLLSNVLRFLQVQKERVERKEITGANTVLLLPLSEFSLTKAE